MVFLSFILNKYSATFNSSVYYLKPQIFIYLSCGVSKILVRYHKCIPISIYIFNVNNENTGAIWETYSKLTLKSLEQLQCSDVNFAIILHIVLLLPLSTLSKQMTTGMSPTKKQQRFFLLI